MSKWNKHSQRWEPSFKQRLEQRAEAKGKPPKTAYYVRPPSPRYIDDSTPAGWQQKLLQQIYYEYPEYKALTYDKMIELKLRGYTLERVKHD